MSLELARFQSTLLEKLSSQDEPDLIKAVMMVPLEGRAGWQVALGPGVYVLADRIGRGEQQLPAAGTAMGGFDGNRRDMLLEGLPLGWHGFCLLDCFLPIPPC